MNKYELESLKYFKFLRLKNGEIKKFDSKFKAMVYAKSLNAELLTSDDLTEKEKEFAISAPLY